MSSPLTSVLETVRRHRPSMGSYPGDKYLEQLTARVHGKVAPLAEPPAGSGLKPIMGEPGMPLIGKTLQVLRHGPSVGLDHYQRFGPVNWSSMLGMRMVNVIGPEASQVVLVNKDKKFSQAGWVWYIGPFFKRGLMLLDGEEHLLHRRIMQEAFTRPRLESYLDQLEVIIEEQIPTWPVDEPFELYPTIKDLSLDIATAVFMGDEHSDETEAVKDAFEDCVRAGLAVIRYPVPGLRWHRGLKSRELLEEYFRSRIPGKRASEDQDLFAALCHVTTEDGQSFSDEDIVGHMIFLMMAAHDTSTITATTVCYFLAKHPEWQERCRAESVAYAGVTGGPMDLAGTEKLESLDLVFQEAMRLVTPVPGLARQAVEDTEILGHFVPAGTMINVGSWSTHLIPQIWAAAESFDPARFDEPRREDKQHRLASQPFGGGVHKCIGMNFGRGEVKAMVHRILLNYRIEVPTEYEVRWDMTSLPSPSDGLPVVLRRL